MEVERKSPEKALLCAGSNMDDLLAAVDVEMGSQNNSALEEASFLNFYGARPNRNGFG